MDQEMRVIEASAESELDAAFASLRQRQVSAILTAADPFFDDHPEQLVALSSRYAVPAIYPWRQFERRRRKSDPERTPGLNHP
jgi:putative tryptophan/tyrosine transport system substrate-binding protein